jgi:hypothetical protein
MWGIRQPQRQTTHTQEIAPALGLVWYIAIMDMLAKERAC